MQQRLLCRAASKRGKNRSGCVHRHWPVIFCNTAPEDPNHDDGQERKQCLEQSAIDLSICRLAKMGADHVVEDLTDCKQETRDGQVCCMMSEIFQESNQGTRQTYPLAGPRRVCGVPRWTPK